MKAIAIFTGKHTAKILEDSGSQSWVLNARRVKSYQFAVLCYNSQAAWSSGDGTVKHGEAFMVGRISDIVPSTETEGRMKVKFSEYALISKPKTWPGLRNPICYTTLEELEIEEEELSFQPMEAVAGEEKIGEVKDDVEGLTIAQAKKGLAQTFNVPIEAIEITIRG